MLPDAPVEVQRGISTSSWRDRPHTKAGGSNDQISDQAWDVGTILMALSTAPSLTRSLLLEVVEEVVVETRLPL